MKRIIIAISFAILSITIYAQQKNADNQEINADNQEINADNQEIIVEGTQLSRLPYLIDVLVQTPMVQVQDQSVVVIGRGIPAVYIESQKVTDLSALWHIAASSVRSITVVMQPGVQYGKDVQAVIEITMKKDGKEGFTLDETFRLDLSRKLAVNNEMELGWKGKDFTVGAFLAYNEVRKETEKNTFKYYYKDAVLQNYEVAQRHPEVYNQRITGRVNAAYDFNKNNRLSVIYALMDLRHDRTITPETGEMSKHPEKRHDIGVEYAGKLGAWNLVVGNNTFFDDIRQTVFKPSATGYYLRKEYDLRTYAKASTPLGNGRLIVGAEYEYDHMDVDKHDDDPSYTYNEDTYLDIHAIHPDHTAAVFASASQKLGRWTIEGGLRYEHRYTAYRPCNDDGLLLFLNDIGDRIEPYISKYYLAGILLSEGELSVKRDYLFPSLKVSTNVGKSQFTLSHTQSSQRPYLGLMRLGLKEAEVLDTKIVRTEKIAATALDWSYRWAKLTATHTYYYDPICSTFDGSVSYNAPHYHAFDFNATLTPQIGVWTPSLNMNMHKQWFDMTLANDKPKLHQLLFNVTMNNIVSLSDNWLITLDGIWHSRGAERNYHYYRADFCLNASVQKTFPRQRLSLILSATNLLKNSYSDVTRYTQAYNNISEGARENLPRVVSLSVRWKY